jgi:hypothetical protein
LSGLSPEPMFGPEASVVTQGRSADPVVVITDVITSPADDRVEAHTIDCPAVGDTIDEFAIAIGGWVLGHHLDVVEVEVEVEGQFVKSAPVELMRQGVAALYPERKGAPCGYWIRLSVLGLPLFFEIVLVAVLVDGERLEIGRVVGSHQPLQSSASPKFRPLMVTSLGRTGTTWLMRLLAEHPQIVTYRQYPYETMAGRYWVQQLRQLSDPEPVMQTSVALRQRLGPAHLARFAAFCQESIDDFYDVVAHAQDQPDATFFAEKYLPNGMPILMSELYPDAREVILVRDVRDVACSILAFNARRGYQDFGRELVATDADFFERLINDMSALARSWTTRAGRAHLVRYEDLILDPEPVVDGILDHVGLDGSEHVVTDMLGRASASLPELEAHRTSSDPSMSIGRWRSDLDPALMMTCRDSLDEALTAFGYEPCRRPVHVTGEPTAKEEHPS